MLTKKQCTHSQLNWDYASVPDDVKTLMNRAVQKIRRQYLAKKDAQNRAMREKPKAEREKKSITAKLKAHQAVNKRNTARVSQFVKAQRKANATQ